MRRRRNNNNNNNNNADDTKPAGRMYMRFVGVRGNVWGGPYDGAFAIESMQFGQGRGISSGRRGNKRTASSASVSEVTTTLTYDSRVNMLHGLSTAAAMFPSCELITCVDPRTTNTLTLTQVMISGFSVSGSTDNPMNCSVSLNFVDMTFETTTQVRLPLAIPGTVATNAATPQCDLTRDGFLRVFRFLPPSALLNAGLACKHWLVAASDARLKLTETTSWEYHQLGNTVIDGWRVPESPFVSKNGGYGGDSDEEEKKEPEVVIYGKEIADNARVPFQRSLFEKPA